MRQKQLLKSLLLLCALIAGSGSAGAASSNADVEPISAASKYVLVTDASTLKAGDKLILVSRTSGDGKAMSTTQNENNRGIESVTFSNRAIVSITDNVQVITLEGFAGAWYFNVGNGYLYAASSSKNYLRTKPDKDDNAKATISITANENATIVFQGNNTNNNLRFNSSLSSYSCYSSGFAPPFIYRLTTAATIDVAFGATGWKTAVFAQNVALREGTKAYIVTSAGENAVLESVSQIKAHTPVLLKATANSTSTFDVIDTEVNYANTNLLEISDNTTGDGVYVLANKSNGVGFYQWNGGLLGAGRVYLPVSIAGAREFLGFAVDETSGITNARCETTANDRVYDLQGRWVKESGTRHSEWKNGLYIVNGKKVVIK